MSQTIDNGQDGFEIAINGKVVANTEQGDVISIHFKSKEAAEHLINSIRNTAVHNEKHIVHILPDEETPAHRLLVTQNKAVLGFDEEIPHGGLTAPGGHNLSE
jgi:hypothetical protein